MTSTCMPAAYTLCGLEVMEPGRFLDYHAAGLTKSILIAGALSEMAYLNINGGGPETYVSPADDPAPWYDPAQPASIEFLGMLAAALPGGYDSPATRSVTPRGGAIQGGSFDPEQLQPREHAWAAHMFASTPRGLDYGKKWLADVLGQVCVSCGVCDSAVRLYAPDDATVWEDGRWLQYEVSTTDGPHFDDKNEYVTLATWTVVAGNPYLFKEPVNVINGVPLIAPGAPGDCIDFATWFCGDLGVDNTCVAIDPPTIGQLAPIITLDASDGAGSGIHILMYDDCPGGEPGVDPRGIMVPRLEQGWTLAIDSAKGVINATDPNGNLVSGSNMVEATGHADPFIVVSDCDDTGCICVGVDHACNQGENVTVTIDVQWRTR